MAVCLFRRKASRMRRLSLLRTVACLWLRLGTLKAICNAVGVSAVFSTQASRKGYAAMLCPPKKMASIALRLFNRSCLFRVNCFNVALLCP